jgi:MoxR-like ATPase
VADNSKVSTTTKQVIAEVERAVVGKRALLEMMMASMLAGGHILLEDYPGLGKTLIARSFAAALGLEFKRIQFTPDHWRQYFQPHEKQVRTAQGTDLREHHPCR